MNTKTEKQYITIPIVALEMLKAAGFISVFRDFCRDHTQAVAYEKTEAAYFAAFQINRYKDFDSFKRSFRYHTTKTIKKL